MNSNENALGQRTNSLALQRLRLYQGCAIINLRHLALEGNYLTGTREITEKNVEKLLRSYEIEGCGNLEPENRVSATIEEEVLTRALAKSNVTREALLDPTNQPYLILEAEDLINCVYGKHRLKAAEKFGETTWLVDLYSSDISTEALVQLREQSPESMKFTIGEIYRSLRSYQISQNTALEQKWWARLGSEDCRKQIRRLQRDANRRELLDKLLPYIGLWKPLKSSQITRMLGLKCPDIMYQYLCDIEESWSTLFGPQHGSLIDSDSVKRVEGLMPFVSLADRERVIGLMDSNSIFPLVKITEERDALKSRLLQMTGRILSLNTLIQDTLFIERPARALHCLCPPKFKESLKKVMLSQWNLLGSGGNLEIQTTEHQFTTTQQTESAFSVCMMQLWLFACRHFVHQGGHKRKIGHSFEWSTEDMSLSKLATLASRLGFKSDQISQLQSHDLGQNMAQGFFKSFCREGFYNYEESKVQSMSNRLASFLQNLPRYMDDKDATPQFTTDKPEFEASHRFNSPTRDEYNRLRRNLFVKQIFGPDQSQSEYVTSLGVMKDIIGCFFGKTLLSRTPDEWQAVHPQIPPRLAEATARSEEADMVIEEEFSAIQPGDSHLSEEALQPSTGFGQNVTEEEIISEPVEMDHHPSGTPDRDVPPLAAGFEDTSQPMETKNYVVLHRKIPEILATWYQSTQEVIVVYQFESRIYYKFFLSGGYNLRAALQDLARDHIFVVINEYGLGTPDVNKVYEAAMNERLILAGKSDNPSQRKELEETTSLDKLRDYILKYDVHTGKRKADTTANRSGKRQKERASSEEL